MESDKQQPQGSQDVPPRHEVFDKTGDLPRGRETRETFIRLGANPDELEAAIRGIAYNQGYREGLWDLLNFLLLGFVLGALVYLWGK